MSNKPIGRNSQCPCGSGKKYKHCCLKAEREDIDGGSESTHSVPIPDGLDDLLSSHMGDLESDLGRKLRPDDELFPNVHLEHCEHEISQGMQAADVDPALIYAFQKTGLLISEENRHLISDEDMQAWEDAIDDYRLRHQSGIEFPIGTVALYGPDDQVTTKIVASVIHSADSDPILERFVGTGIADDERVQEKIKALFAKHEVTNVAATDRNMGCPHEEGEDFPIGEDCPFCPFWKGKQGSAAVTDDDEPSADEMEMAMQLFQSLNPEMANQLKDLAMQFDDPDEFMNMLMVGPCPNCESENTSDCEDMPEIEDPSIGRCNDCQELWCCDCGEAFESPEQAAHHECAVWEETEDELDEPF